MFTNKDHQFEAKLAANKQQLESDINKYSEQLEQLQTENTCRFFNRIIDLTAYKYFFDNTVQNSNEALYKIDAVLRRIELRKLIQEKVEQLDAIKEQLLLIESKNRLNEPGIFSKVISCFK